jgi:hypothetical protein
MTVGWRRLPLLSLALVSGAALGYQVLLLRVFSIIQWHHLAYMVIGLALLGYGASGTVLTLTAARVRPRAAAIYSWSILLFSLATLPAFLLAQSLAFSPEELLWRPGLAWRLVAIYLVLATPFFLAACAAGTAFIACPRRVPRLYAADLVGAGAGALAALATMHAPSPTLGLLLMATLGLLGALIAVVELRCARVPVLAAAALAVAGALLLPADTLELEPSPYKDLEETLRIAGARIEAQRAGPRGQVTVVGSPLVPLREAPGMSLVAGVEPPPQRALFVNGDAVTGITRDDGRPASLTFLDRLPTALPYHLLRPGRVLVPRAGGGLLALQARHAGALRVDALVEDPNVLALLRGPYAEFSGALYVRPPVRALRADARAFLERTGASYDLIQIGPSGSLTAAGAGLQAMHEDFLYTVEALATAYERLSPEGALAVSAWIRLPPRDSLKLAGMLVTMLREAGVAEPGNHLAVVRAWQMATFVATRAPLSDAAIERLRRFAEARGFDLAWYPGMKPAAANRINRMPEPTLYDGISRMLTEGPESLIADYKFDLRPATDDRPFFHNFLRWRSLPEVSGLLGAGGMPLLEAGFVLLLATLAQALVLAAVLILLPLALSRERRRVWAGDRGRGRVLIYFAGIGLGFMIVELVALHRLVLLVGNPVLTSALVLALFLLAAGGGSLYAGRAADLTRAARVAGAATVVTALAWHGLLDLFAPALSAVSPAAAAALAALSLVPMAFFMGQLFPLGLTAVGRSHEGMIPWAWGINGCASVVGAIAGTALAVSIGFGASLLLAAGVYAVATLNFPAATERCADA